MSEVSQPEESATTRTAAQKLWFDHIVKLNDRVNQAAQFSGATNWILTAVLGTLVFKAAPDLAVLSSSPKLANEVLVLSLLTLNLFIWGAFAIAFLLLQCGADVGQRLLPERSRPLEQLMFWITTIAGTIVVFAQVVAFRSAADAAARWISLGLGLWLAANLLVALRKRVKRIRAERAFKVPLPRFHGTPIPHEAGWIATLLFVPFVAASIYGWWAEFRTVVSLFPNYWWNVSRLSAYAVGFLLVAGYLFARATAQQHAAWLRDLESKILTENLDPAEIRSRFLSYSLGPTIGDWLADLARREEQAQHNNQLFLENAERTATSIEAIDPNYGFEKAGRARKLVEEVMGQARKHLAELKAINAELQQLKEARVSQDQRDQLEKVLALWEQRNQTITKQGNFSEALISRMEKLAGVTQPKTGMTTGGSSDTPAAS